MGKVKNKSKFAAKREFGHVSSSPSRNGLKVMKSEDGDEIEQLKRKLGSPKCAFLKCGNFGLRCYVDTGYSRKTYSIYRFTSLMSSRGKLKPGNLNGRFKLDLKKSCFIEPIGKYSVKFLVHKCQSHVKEQNRIRGKKQKGNGEKNPKNGSSICKARYEEAFIVQTDNKKNSIVQRPRLLRKVSGHTCGLENNTTLLGSQVRNCNNSEFTIDTPPLNGKKKW